MVFGYLGPTTPARRPRSACWRACCDRSGRADIRGARRRPQPGAGPKWMIGYLPGDFTAYPNLTTVACRLWERFGCNRPRKGEDSPAA